MRDPAPTARMLTSLGQFGERARPTTNNWARRRPGDRAGSGGDAGGRARPYHVDQVLLPAARFRPMSGCWRWPAAARCVRTPGCPAKNACRSKSTPCAGRTCRGVIHRSACRSGGRIRRARPKPKRPDGVRAHSRLLLYHNAALIGDTLFKLVQWLHEVGSGRDLKLARRIYVLASLAEAESSGMIFDIVSRLRALAADRPTTIMGIFSLRASPLPATRIICWRWPTSMPRCARSTPTPCSRTSTPPRCP